MNIIDRETQSIILDLGVEVLEMKSEIEKLKEEVNYLKNIFLGIGDLINGDGKK
ncbi:MAG: hypothetical protein ACTSVA_00885 [Candidatus Njordarchaeales archaeon]